MGASRASGLVCPRCARPRLEVVAALAVPPGWMWDEEDVQVIACGACPFRGAATLAISRRGALDSESSDHIGYWLAAPWLAVLERQIAACPDPRSERCACASHAHLGRHGAGGDWRGLDDLPLGERFVVRWSEEGE